jgi:hypothetical protein
MEAENEALVKDELDLIVEFNSGGTLRGTLLLLTIKLCD